MSGVILTYHRINPEPPPSDHWGTSVSLPRFEDQIAALRRHFEIVPFRDLPQRASAAMPVAITFDDGYLSTLSLAKPALARQGLPATVFLATGYLDRRWFWWDRLEAIMADARQAGRVAPEKFADELLAQWNALRGMAGDLRRAALDRLAKRLDVGGAVLPEDRPMTLAEAMELPSPLIDIGAHTVSHPWLAALSDAAALREIALSAVQCREIAGRDLAGFAFPFGSWSPRVAEQVRQAGMALACTTATGAVDPSSNLLALPRLAVGEWSGEELVERILALAGARPAGTASKARQPAVSVVIPLYDKAAYIGECLASVMAQSFRDFEVLIVDDGSTDGSAEIAAAWQRAHPEVIRILRHPGRVNRGVSQSRNLAIAKSLGRYIAYLDADDLWHPGKLGHDVAILERNPEAMAVVSHTLYWWQDGREPARVDHLGTSLDRIVRPGEMFRSSYITGATESPCVCAVTLRRAAAADLGWDTSLAVAEDLKYFAALLHRFPVYLSSACLSEYRRLADSAWSAGMADGRESAAHERFQEWLKGLESGAATVPEARS